MDIVISIDGGLYEWVHRQLGADEGWSMIQDAIMSGKVLPKGHGDLIDRDEFHHTLEDMPIRDNDKWFNWSQKACNRLAEAPTVIEADKEKINET